MKRGIILLVLFGILAINLVAASSYSLEFNQLGKSLVIKENINNTQNKIYTDSDSLNFAGNEIYFLNKVTFPGNFENAVIRLNLEKGIVVKNKEVFPLGYKIETDGQIISVVWNLDNVKQGNNFAMFVSLEDTKKTISSYFFIGFIFIILIFGAWLFFSKKRDKKVKKSVPKKTKVKETEKYNYLLDTEKKIIEEIKKANRNELWQKQIQTSTGFSKAKVSRLVRNLESRGLITKIPFGNTNKIRLK